MTRLSGDLDMVRHSIAWIIKSILECIVLYSASVIFFFSIDWLMALCMIALTPVILQSLLHSGRSSVPDTLICVTVFPQ